MVILHDYQLNSWDRLRWFSPLRSYETSRKKSYQEAAAAAGRGLVMLLTAALNRSQESTQ